MRLIKLISIPVVEVLRRVKHLGERRFPTYISRLWFFWSLYKAHTHRVRLKSLGCKVFSYSELKKRFKFDSFDNVLVLGSGSSIKELSSSFFTECSGSFSFAVGRWFYHEFVPNIIFVESELSNSLWIDSFINGLNNKQASYKDTVILIHLEDPAEETVRLLKNRLHKKLYKNVRFVSLTTAAHCSEYFEAVLSSSLIRRIGLFSNTLFHCRSSVSIGGSIALLLGFKEIILAGVDGYSGYFRGEENEEFHFSGISANSKNIDGFLHSTSDPAHGLPTITDCFIGLNQIIPVSVTSSNVVLARHLKLYNKKSFAVND